MVVFSKILRRQCDSSARQPLLLLLASILVFRSAFLPSNNNTPTVTLPVSSQADLASHARLFPLHPQQRNGKSKLSLSFWQQFRSLLRIVIPSIRSREALLLLAHSCFLVLRTVLSLAVAKLDGRIVRDLVSADGYGFLRGLALWFALAVPSIYTNSMVRRPPIPETRADLSARSVTCSRSSLSALGAVSLGTSTTSTSRPHLTFAITASPFRASTSISQPMSSPGQKVSLAYSTCPVPADMLCGN
jgi:hypothetical protein